MTKDEIIRIAKEANLVFREEYFEVASKNSDGIMFNDLTKFAELVADAEREKCWKLADCWDDYDVHGLADAIAKRGEE